jgi:hypothetical protein
MGVNKVAIRASNNIKPLSHSGKQFPWNTTLWNE